MLPFFINVSVPNNGITFPCLNIGKLPLLSIAVSSNCFAAFFSTFLDGVYLPRLRSFFWDICAASSFPPLHTNALSSAIAFNPGLLHPMGRLLNLADNTWLTWPSVQLPVQFSSP